MNDLSIDVKELSKSRTMIQGFNLECNRVVGMILVELTMGKVSTSSIFHVIDAMTSYKFSLGLQLYTMPSILLWQR